MEKRNGKFNKTTNKSNSAIASQEDMLHEIKSLWDQIEDRIKDLASEARVKQDGHPSKETVEELNKLKLERKKIKDAHHQVNTADDETWRTRKDHYQKIYYDARTTLENYFDND